mgnify:CR=1 FL=1
MSHICSPLCYPPVHALKVLTDGTQSLEEVIENVKLGLLAESEETILHTVREVHEVDIHQWARTMGETTNVYENTVWSGEVSVTLVIKMEKAYIAMVEIVTLEQEE